MADNHSILFITAFHPSGSGVIGAGEAISGETVDSLLASGKTVHVLCLAPPSQSANPELVARCQSYCVLEQTRGQALDGVTNGLGCGSFLAPWLFTRGSRRNIEMARSIIDRFSVSEVWLDFPSTLAFAPYLQGTTVNYFVHDVVSQKIARRGLLRLLLPAVRMVERRLLAHVTRCAVLAEKDAELLRNLGFEGEVEVRPPLWIKPGRVDDGTPVECVLEAFQAGRNLVFFGNMKRLENHASVMHFLLWGYPKIRRRHRDVQFWILGLSPRWTLRLLGHLLPGVHVVGAVDDPDPAFRAATICVAPLRLGAGVKIKVLQMLNAGATVVASPVGAEGIASTSKLMVVPYEDIPDVVCRLLSDENE